jgi:hypothetical protein
MPTQRFASGRTLPTDWVVYSPTGIMVDVNTSAGHFTGTPEYFTSIGGNSSHWNTTGATSIYLATPTGFRVYVRWANGVALTPTDAVNLGWYINWWGTSA